MLVANIELHSGKPGRSEMDGYGKQIQDTNPALRGG